MPRNIYIKICKWCQTEFETFDKRRKFCCQYCSGKFSGESQKRKNKKCITCNKEFYPNYSTQKFCSHSCSATYTNTGRIVSKETIKKLRILCSDNNLYSKTALIKLRNAISSNRNHPDIWGVYSIVYFRTCIRCKSTFTATNKAFLCDIHKYPRPRDKYNFQFNIFNYPDLFELELIKKYGFYNSVSNPNGITRDHRVSAMESLQNDYDVYYITHPINCKLMFWDENIKKNSNSSITYEQLVKEVDEYNNFNLASPRGVEPLPPP